MDNGPIDAAAGTTQGFETLTPDFCVIGAGPGGLSVAKAAVAFGRRVVLVERQKMGGDSLNYGCVPSKALIAAANRAHAMRTAADFGIESVDPRIDPTAVHAHVKGVLGAIAPNCAMERFAGLGVRVIQAAGRFLDPETVTAGEILIKARHFVIASGSSAVIPQIAGLETIAFFTNETIFDNRALLDHLVVIGAGQVGLELAQAYRRLGSRVTVIERGKALGRDDPELTAVVLDALRREGIVILEDCTIDRVSGAAGSVRLEVAGAGRHVVEGTHLLLAAGRRANIAELGLSAAAIKHDGRGITVDKGMRTSNRRVFAIGDATGGPQYTHLAHEHAGIVIRRALFRIPARLNEAAVPWVTFTDPELAHVGLLERQARTAYGKVHVLRWPYHENDRAQAERHTAGHIKVVTSTRGKILGAEIAGAHASELIQVWALAISKGLRIGAMASYIPPYPTFSEINKHVALRSYGSAAGNTLLRKVIDVLAKLG